MMNCKGLTPGRAILSGFVTPLALCAVIALTSVPASAGPIGWNAFGGWYTDPRNFELGAGARVGFGSVTFNPNAEYIFTENATSYTLNLDGTMSVMPLGVASVYAGGGVTWSTQDPDNGDSHTDSGINVLAGAGLNAIPFKPYGQIKWAFLPDDTPFSFSFGLRF